MVWGYVSRVVMSIDHSTISINHPLADLFCFNCWSDIKFWKQNNLKGKLVAKGNCQISSLYYFILRRERDYYKSFLKEVLCRFTDYLNDYLIKHFSVTTCTYDQMKMFQMTMTFRNRKWNCWMLKRCLVLIWK